MNRQDEFSAMVTRTANMLKETFERVTGESILTGEPIKNENMKYFYGHPDDPENPQGGTDIDNEQLSEQEIDAAEQEYEAKKSDI